MALYRREGVNPMASLGGCLPLVIQLPILSAFYCLLSVSIELRMPVPAPINRFGLVLSREKYGFETSPTIPSKSACISSGVWKFSFVSP